MNPEHIHLLINHVPIHGLALATLFLFLALIFKKKSCTIFACVGVLLTSLSIPFVMGSGESAFERYKHTQEIRDHISDAGLQYAHLHYEHAETGAKLTYLLILLSAATLLSLKFKPDWFTKLSWVTLFVAILALLANAWIASSGGKIRRPDFQNSEADFSHIENH